ncbi:hypothetical protein ACFU7D_10525 [Nocardioides sp. NPDC057577]|uniref:hypothetical protein n=1 Tax=unclassified Nocardioides TaxID=2615069 RepID=UPI00365A2251
MDPHSTPTSAYETEVEAERPRGGIPAFLNAVLVTGGLWALQFLSGSTPFSTWIEENGSESAGWVAALLGDRLTYFGDGSFSGLFSGDDLGRSAVLTGTVFVLTWLLTWLSTIGIWPRAFWPVFLGCWFAATVATAAGQVAGSLYSYLTGGSDLFVATLGDALELGAAYGLTYGWATGLLIALIWLAIPGKSDEVEEYTPMSSLISGSGPGGGTGGAPGGYGQQLRTSVAVPTAQTSLARVSTSQPTQPVQVRTFTGPARGQGPAGDTAAWKDFVRDVRGRS